MRRKEEDAATAEAARLAREEEDKRRAKEEFLRKVADLKRRREEEERRKMGLLLLLLCWMPFDLNTLWDLCVIHAINAEEEEERQKLEAQKREEERLALMRMAESERQEYLRMYWTVTITNWVPFTWEVARVRVCLFAGRKREEEERRTREEQEARKQRQDEMKRSLGTSTKEFPVYAPPIAHSVVHTSKLVLFIRGGQASGDWTGASARGTRGAHEVPAHDAHGARGFTATRASPPPPFLLFLFWPLLLLWRLY